MSVTIVAEGLSEFASYLDRLPDVTVQAAVLAINQTAERKAVSAARRDILEQVAFPKDYLNADRLGVRSKATRENLEATVGARQRPTSLARFASGTVASTRKGGVRVMVKPGKQEILKRAFLVKLRAGATVTNDNFNLGLAVRVSPGTTLRKSQGAQKLGRNLYLLYGPSVDQVFRTVADDITPEVLDALATEFLRQFDRLSGE